MEAARGRAKHRENCTDADQAELADPTRQLDES